MSVTQKASRWFSRPGRSLPFPYKLMEFTLHSTDEGGKMQNLRDIALDSTSARLNAFGGEPLAGSGFETEEPESGFAGAEQVEE